MQTIGKTYIGARATNQDAFFAGKNLYIICDGVGGALSGEVASRLACSSISDYFEATPTEVYDDEYLHQVLQHTVSILAGSIEKNPKLKTMATTVALLAFDKSGAIIGWMGDSRVYHFRKDQLLYVTQDHSLLNALKSEGVDSNVISNLNKNIITRSLSIKNKDRLSTHRIAQKDILTGDLFLICTDGLFENINETDIGVVVNSGRSLENMSAAFLSASDGNTEDNFTFQIIRV